MAFFTVCPSSVSCTVSLRTSNRQSRTKNPPHKYIWRSSICMKSDVARANRGQSKFNRGSSEKLQAPSELSGRKSHSLTLFSPAKINVFLRITSKRADGYHNIASLFHTVNFGDTIQFSPSDSSSEDILYTNAQGVPVDDRNLIIKALNLYRMKTGSKIFFQINLHKKIPTGAGLGGGSSNAATALWAANYFNNYIATTEDLQKWSGEIGSDIPFFFSHGAAYCTGRGEVVQDISPSPVSLNTPMILMKPQQECPTAQVYRLFQLSHASSVEPLELLQEISRNGISQNVCINDLEAPAFELLPSLKKLKQQALREAQGQYIAVFMSGSGSTIVGVGDKRPPQFIYDKSSGYHDMFVSESRRTERPERKHADAVTQEGSANANKRTRKQGKLNGSALAQQTRQGSLILFSNQFCHWSVYDMPQVQ
eukprot:TRINITY_DN6669_c0_g1_i1.p1 TRINITY_DN6669_c0_g1~~TRINITY_DN6669_c0_g1_i1.p1  ORF type:complete len:424 (+),score=74.79 TRINITY_DN6669_c0_g1_i1:136-1407(+)